MPDVFVSHASADDSIVSQLHDELETATRCEIWVDHKDIKPGQDWQGAIDDALRGCANFLLVLSRHSVRSKEVTAEWRAALALEKNLLVAAIDDIPPEDIPYRLVTIQWVNLHKDWHTGLLELTGAIGPGSVAVPSDESKTPAEPERSRITFTLDMELKAFDQASFVALIAQLAEIEASDIRVVLVREGSLSITLDLPSAAAQHVLFLAQHQPVHFAEFHPQDIKLTEGAEPPHFRRWPLTGFIDPRLVRIPMSGRDRDLVRAKELLKKGPTSILGVGGLGKSRLAAEVVMTNEGIEGAVWHNATDVSQAEDLLALLREHFALEPSASRQDILSLLRNHKRLIVFDNAEAVSADRRAEHVALLNQLYAAGAQVLITARVEWEELTLGQALHPSRLELSAAQQVVKNMQQVFGIEQDLEPVAAELAKAARYHPRLIEWAVRQAKKFPSEKVVRDLQTLTSKRIQDALEEMIHKTLHQMGEIEGEQLVTALRRLGVFRAGFTYEAAGAILNLEEDEDRLDHYLETLQTWQFITMLSRKGEMRYEVEPLALASMEEPEPDALMAHFEFFRRFAQRLSKKQDFAALEPETANLEAAFEWVFAHENVERAYWFRTACSDFLSNRGRFRQNADWLQRLISGMTSQSVPDETKAAFQNSLGNAYRDLAQLEARDTNLR
ncbi:toll/interleukin-1 receptor domain-containing protein, partial [Aggregatilinea lenta]|uniref:toll/interleukin-1 receptor domain-containing protein n=1 Tax=Aggregatilinea lenta TaxID=913108 RepID=UPI0013C319FC